MEADDEISLDFHPLTTPNDNIIHTLPVDELGMKLVGASIVAGLAWWMKKPNSWGENWDSSIWRTWMDVHYIDDTSKPFISWEQETIVRRKVDGLYMWMNMDDLWVCER